MLNVDDLIFKIMISSRITRNGTAPWDQKMTKNLIFSEVSCIWKAKGRINILAKRHAGDKLRARKFKICERLAETVYSPSRDPPPLTSQKERFRHHCLGGITRPMTTISLFLPSHSSGSGVSANKPPPCSAGYLSPNTDALSTRSRRRCNSSGVRCTCTASKFSFKYFGVIVLRDSSVT